MSTPLLRVLALLALALSACGSSSGTTTTGGDSGYAPADLLPATDASVDAILADGQAKDVAITEDVRGEVAGNPSGAEVGAMEDAPAQLDAPHGTLDVSPDAPIAVSIDATVDASGFDGSGSASDAANPLFTVLATVPKLAIASGATVTAYAGHHLLVSGPTVPHSYEEGFVFSVDGVTGQASEAKTYVGGGFPSLYNQFAEGPLVVPLSDQTILFAGGGYRSMATWYGVSTVATLDPSTLETTAMPDMLATRVNHTGTVLLDGTILFAGGSRWMSEVVASAEVYDPLNRKSSLVDPMLSARSLHRAVRLANGTVLVVGGYAKAQSETYDPAALVTFAELYDPATQTFAKTGAMGQGRVFHSTTLLQNGRVLVVGGTLPTAAHPGEILPGIAFANATAYGPDSGLFTDVGALATGRYRHSETLLPDGRVLILGGMDAAGAHLASAELYDPASGTFTTIGNMNVPREGHGAFLMDNGKVIIAGGDTNGVIEILDPAAIP